MNEFEKLQDEIRDRSYCFKIFNAFLNRIQKDLNIIKKEKNE